MIRTIEERRVYQREWAAKNKDRLRIYRLKWTEKQKGRIREARRLYRATDRGRVTDFRARKRGCNSTFDEILAVVQTHCCAFCGRAESDVRFPIDHCHKTGKVRGLLCPKHNVMLRDGDEMERLIVWARSFE